MASERKAVPKVSPLKGSSVDDYIATLRPDQAAIVSALRALIHAAAPSASEAIKWSQPVFEDNGPFAYIKPAAEHVTFGFWCGSELPDPNALLEGGGRMRHVILTSAADIDAPAMKAFIKAAVKLNRETGDPTKRMKKS